MGVTVRSSHIAAPFSSGGGLLTLFLYSSMRSLLWETVTGTDCSSVGPPWSHKSFQQICSRVESSLYMSTGPGRSLFQHGLSKRSQLPLGIHLLRRGSVPWGAVLQEQAAPAWVPHGVASPASKPALVQASLSPQVQRSCQEPVSVWASHRVTASFKHPPALVWGLPGTAGGYRIQCGPPWTAEGTACLTILSFKGCRGISAPVPGAPPPPPSSLALELAKLFLSHSLIPLSRLMFHSKFFPFLNMFIEVPRGTTAVAD